MPLVYHLYIHSLDRMTFINGVDVALSKKL